VDEHGEHLVGDVVRLVDTASFGWAGLRRWRLDRGSAAAAAGEVRQDAGSGGYQLRRIFAGTARLASLPAVYDAYDTSGQAWLRVEMAAARMGRTSGGTVHLGDGGPGAVVPPVRSLPIGVGLTVATPDGGPLLVVPEEHGLSWSALDPAGVPVARIEHIAARAGWVDRSMRNRSPNRLGGRNPDDDPSLSGDVITFERRATPLHRALVLGVAICRAHRRS
jgi:hypothetical protein